MAMATALQDWLVPQWPAPNGVKALFTTRTAGGSLSPYDRMNLGLHVGDDPQQVATNRALLQGVMGVRPVFLRQVHGCGLREVHSRTGDDEEADGAVACSPGVACTVMTADCLPILLCDRAGTRVAALHAGWRGLAGTQGEGIVEAFFKQIMSAAPVEYAQPATEFIAWLGPCIGPKAFQVGSEVRSAFLSGHPDAAQCFTQQPGGQWLADLALLARQRLQSLGLHAVFGNDGSAPWCTVGNPLRFFSYRRNRVTGRHAACIWLE